jgi:hypothetical protein
MRELPRMLDGAGAVLGAQRNAVLKMEVWIERLNSGNRLHLEAHGGYVSAHLFSIDAFNRWNESVRPPPASSKKPYRAWLMLQSAFRTVNSGLQHEYVAVSLMFADRPDLRAAGTLAQGAAHGLLHANLAVAEGVVAGHIPDRQAAEDYVRDMEQQRAWMDAFAAGHSELAGPARRGEL